MAISVYRLFFFILLFCSSNIFAALPDTTLKHLCLRAYEQDSKKCNLARERDILIEELLEDSSRRTKIFLVQDCLIIDGGHYHLNQMFFRFYVIDKDSGLLVDLTNRKTFNKEIRKIKPRLSNLEICYLYLLLNHMEPFGINDFSEYSLDLKSPMVCLELEGQLFDLKFEKCDGAIISDYLLSQISSDIQKSTNRTIYIYTTMGRNEKFDVCRYKFRLKKRNELKTIDRKFF